MSEHPAPVPHVLVSPRHLAGAGDRSLVTTHLRDHGWREVSTPADLRTDLESPDATMRLCLELDPERSWWTVLGAPHDGGLWHATFQARTPAEMILAFAQALTHPDEVPGSDPFHVLHDAGWTRPVVNRLHQPHYKRESPEGYLVWDLRRDEDVIGWHVRSRIHGTPMWSAALSTHTPLPAVTAFAAALADSEPLPRAPSSVPLETLKLMSRRSAATSTPLSVLPVGQRPSPALRNR
ncbi:DUF317 domain-containing protein [Streptomyces sp. SID13726]|uniref:DUF317 domain-containing protein n=1 Tax=Streptomyces sp. SID13726 TaxID=2706058 RepID=UPI0013B5CB03|nr:DUF317 domain-containing protein [Streptomyces sp. SID13726]NEB01987.1 DUF317 domain-containing protein [Streptomyces sp. SID13726]